MNTSRRSFFKFLAGAILAPTLPDPTRKPQMLGIYWEVRHLPPIKPPALDICALMNQVYAIKHEREKNSRREAIDVFCDTETADIIQDMFYARGNSAHPS